MLMFRHCTSYVNKSINLHGPFENPHSASLISVYSAGPVRLIDVLRKESPWPEETRSLLKTKFQYVVTLSTK